MNRRQFVALAALAPAPSAAAPAISINAGRLRQRLEALSEFGRPPGGTFADGVTRVAFTEPYIAACRWLQSELRAAGMKVRVDAAGNIFGRLEGTDATLAPVLSGSHIDSVPSGGNFDGPLGTLAAFEAIQTLAERGVKLKRPLEIVAWTGEEGAAFGRGLFGSSAATRGLTAADLANTWNGMTLREALIKVGGDPDRTGSPWIKPGDYARYVELHIEQGMRMVRDGLQIGIVEGIVASIRFALTIRGEANHAGTTMMADRRDALVAASELVLAANRIASSMPGNQVATVGMLNIRPTQAANVIPGHVEMTVGMRDMSAATLKKMADQFITEIDRVKVERRVEIRYETSDPRNGTPCAPEMMDLIERAAERRGLRSRRMPSGAGHDASNMAGICPMGMVFAPSIGGISHSPQELTPWEDCANAANVVLDTLQELAA